MPASRRCIVDMAKLLIVCLMFVGGVQWAQASAGDRSYEYFQCYRQCSYGCPSPGPTTRAVDATGQPFDFWTRLFLWDCGSDCQYRCMVDVEVLRAERGFQPVKYHGKWPFVRVLGMQELASTVFSIGNLLPHAIYLLCYRHLYAPRGSHRRWVHLTFSIIGINTWLWSAAFHARDTWLTERLDYHGATLMLTYSLFAAVTLVFDPRPLFVWILGALAAVFLIGHVSYLNFVKFDYGYNMTVSLVIGIISAAVWVLGSARHWKPHSYKAVLFWLALHFAAILEVFDFPPIGNILDAHAFWHAATIPLGFLWYSFLCDDVQHNLSHLAKQHRAEMDAKESNDVTGAEADLSGNANEGSREFGGSIGSIGKGKPRALEPLGQAPEAPAPSHAISDLPDGAGSNRAGRKGEVRRRHRRDP